MTPPHRPPPIEVASAADVAGRVSARKEGNRWRTRGYCHGSGDKPDSGSLIFNDPARPGLQSLHVHCFKCNPTTPAERDRIRHALQEATGLQLCKCPECRGSAQGSQHARPPASRPKQPAAAPIAAKTGAESPAVGNAGRNRDDTNDYAAALWQRAKPSTQGPPHNHPAGKWIRRFNVWPPGAPLPDAIRWLSKRQLPGGENVRPASTAAGALVLAMRRIDEPTGAVRKVQLVAIDDAGDKAQHWQGKPADKRSFGSDSSAYGWLTHWPDTPVGSELHVCEGVKDGLALLAGLPFQERTGSAAAAFRYARAGNIAVAVSTGKGYQRIDPGFFTSVTLWPDADDPEALPAAQAQAQRWIDQGHANIHIEHLPRGYDPAAIAQEQKHD